MEPQGYMGYEGIMLMVEMTKELRVVMMPTLLVYDFNVEQERKF